MEESFKSKRVVFPKNKQQKFILESKKDLAFTWNELASFIGISPRNLIDWKNEKISLSFGAVKIICKKRNISLPENIEIKDRYWYVKKGAKKGGLAVLKKYGAIGGDSKIRKEKWQKWWEAEGKYKKHKILEPLPFRKPKYSKELSEFVGIVLGDGGISQRQITITLHRITDEKYSRYVRKLVKKLFGIKAGTYKNSKYLADDIVISRSELVKYCANKLGLKIGNKIKNQVDIPEWIKKNKQYKIGCLRGLVDTDGCVIIHKYRVRNKIYFYKKISFTSRSLPLLMSAKKILGELGIDNRIAKDGFDIRVEARESVRSYFNQVGSHNPKHLERYKKNYEEKSHSWSSAPHC